MIEGNEIQNFKCTFILQEGEKIGRIRTNWVRPHPCHEFETAGHR